MPRCCSDNFCTFQKVFLKTFPFRFLAIACSAILLGVPVSVWAQVTPAPMWLNILGDPGNPAADTVEVNPDPVSVNGPLRTMRVRVNRSGERKNWDGVPYRSYIAEVLFNCNDNNARYVAMEYYMQPNWKGEAHAATKYTPSEARPMRFRDVTPNPAAQIIKAACRTSDVTSD